MDNKNVMLSMSVSARFRAANRGVCDALSTDAWTTERTPATIQLADRTAGKAGAYIASGACAAVLDNDPRCNQTDHAAHPCDELEQCRRMRLDTRRGTL